jgi:phage tail-like protein
MTTGGPGRHNAYTGGRFALELDQRKQAGFLTAIDGGHFKGDPVTSMVGADNYVTKYTGKPKYDDITITIGMAMSPSFWQWVAGSLAGKPERRNGALVHYDFDFYERSRRTFYGALISEIQFPALDAAQKQAASLAVKFTPERLEFKKGDGSRLKRDGAPDEAAKQKKWLSSNFRFELERFKGDESLRNIKLESFTVKQNVIDNPIGYELETRKEVGRLELPQLVVTFSEHKASEWMKWYDAAVVKGNRKDQYTTGVLTYYDSSPKREELMRIEIGGVSMASLEVDKLEGHKEGIANVKVTLNIEAFKLVPGKGNA